MDKEKVETVVQLCDELKKRAKKWEAAWKRDKYMGSDGKMHVITYNTPKESAALRRISMELTRALADMRRP